jgi:hypothetical protein
MATDIPWLRFWEIVLCVGIGSFVLLVLAVIPLGARDIKRMFARLDAMADAEEDASDST